MQEALKPEQLGQYAVTGDLNDAAQGKVPASGLISMPRADKTGEGGSHSALLYKKDSKTKRKGKPQAGGSSKRQRGGKH